MAALNVKQPKRYANIRVTVEYMVELPDELSHVEEGEYPFSVFEALGCVDANNWWHPSPWCRVVNVREEVA